MVDHKVLLSTLHNCLGIEGDALQWYKSYLEDRHIKVSIRKDYSKEHGIGYSVPKGSIQGPVLLTVIAVLLFIKFQITLRSVVSLMITHYYQNSIQTLWMTRLTV